MRITKNCFALLRISEEKHIDSLQCEGHLYCNPIDKFRFASTKEERIRQDANEGKDEIRQVQNLGLLVQESQFQADSTQLYKFDNRPKGNIHCFYGIETNSIDSDSNCVQPIVIRKEMHKYGTHALLIFDILEYHRRLKNKLDELAVKFDFGPVHYYDEKTYEGRLTPFMKSTKYEHENEIRLFIPNKQRIVLEFRIGDITDISYKFSIDKLDKVSVQVHENHGTKKRDSAPHK